MRILDRNYFIFYNGTERMLSFSFFIIKLPHIYRILISKMNFGMEVSLLALKLFFGKRQEGLAKDSNNLGYNQNLIRDLYQAMARQVLTL